MYTLLAMTEPRARKEYPCIWCRERILRGEKHIHEVSTYEDQFQDHRWHPECKRAADFYFKTTGETDFMPHECKRGACEEV